MVHKSSKISSADTPTVNDPVVPHTPLFVYNGLITVSVNKRESPMPAEVKRVQSGVYLMFLGGNVDEPELTTAAERATGAAEADSAW